MCGVNGQFVIADSHALDPQLAEHVSARLAHRGPEQAGSWNDELALLAHRRLVLLDEQGGIQPMATDAAILAYNGELYNHHELRSELAVRGVRFAGRSDTEVVLAAYQTFGDDAWRRLNGMFAIAVYDRRQRSLRLVRDPLGIKPLFFAASADRIDFASEPAPLAADCRPDPAGILHFLRFAQPVHHQRTVIAGVNSVLPGEYRTFDQTGTVTSLRMDSLAAADPPADDSNVLRAKLRHLLRRAVERQAEADAPVGLFLSGGVDSAVLAAILREVQSAPPRTFSVALEHDDAELDAARDTARHFQTEHVELRVTCDRFFAALRELTQLRGLPVCYPNEPLIFALAAAARESVKIVLTGEGADELFGGYSRVMNSLIAYLDSEDATANRRTLVRRSLELEHDNADLSSPSRFYAAITAWWQLPDLIPLLRPEFRSLAEDPNTGDPFADHFAVIRGLTSFAGARHVLMHAHLPNLLARLDGATMAASIEGRVPYTDRDLMQFVLAVPYEQSAITGNKELLRAAFQDRLPIANRRRAKRPFDASLQVLFASREGQQEIADLTQSETIAEIFDMNQLRLWLNRNEQSDILQRLWLLVCLNRWLSRNIN
jgi:asparagine synthase (glutamine-hydrolysing)